MKRSLLLLTAVAVFVAAGAIGIWTDLSHPGALIGDVVFSTWLAAVLAVGSVIAWRHPSNMVGWLFVGAAVILAMALASKGYAWAAYHSDLELPGRQPAAWLSHWLALPGGGLLLFAMILFPAGHLPSHRWRWPARILGAAFVVAALGPMFKAGPIDGLGKVANPYAAPWGDGLWALSQIAQPVAAGAVAALIVSLVLRSRRGELVERQQIKWITYALAMLPIAFFASQAVQIVDQSREDWMGFAVIMVALVSVPVAIGVAILRYRLYDIDLVVNRTIVYVLLTAFLGGAYAGGVTVVQTLIPIARGNDLTVAASTLAMAALFQPARRRIQRWIDHLFYRRKYDAQRTIDAFSSRLRDEIDLDSLENELMDVVFRTMQPSHLSVWVTQGRIAGDRA